MTISAVNYVEGQACVAKDQWIGHLLNQAALRIRTMTAAALAPHDITPPQLRALEVIAREQPLSQVRLSELVGMDRSTIVHVVDLFEQLGVASREVDRTDRRSHAVMLTAKGERLLRDARGVARGVEDRFLVVLSPREREALGAMLAKLFEPTPCPEEKRP